MKTLALLLLPLALSTSLSAQSNKHLSEHSLNAQIISGDRLLSEQGKQGQKVQNDQQANITALACATEAAELDMASEDDFSGYNNKPKKKKNHNKGYSIAGEVSYTTGVGFYSGSMDAGFSAKHFIKGNTAVEGILAGSWRYRGLRLTGLYEIQKPIGTEGLYWYWGVGAHVGTFSEEYWNKGECKEGRYEQNGKWYNCDGSRATVGIDGTVGIEYQFTGLPFTISLGVKPSVDLIGRSNYFGDGALAFRYAF